MILITLAMSQYIGGNMNKKAFTLSEILITLGIIGIIAAMTLPSLVQRHNDIVTVNKIKKFYSAISQVWSSILYEEGSLENWDIGNDAKMNGELIFSKFVSKLQILKNCSNTQSGCVADDYYKTFTGSNIENFTTDNRRYNAILADGSSVSIILGSVKYGRSGAIYFDINGPKSPNRFGFDMFQFSLLDRVTPQGATLSDEQVLNDCLSGGYNCSTWIIRYGNLDYKYCPDKLKVGKKSCTK